LASAGARARQHPIGPEASAGPDPDTTPRPHDAVEVARILGAWGVKGGIRLKPFSSDPQALFSSRRWYIAPGETPRPSPPSGRELPPPPSLLHVVQAREHGDGVVATTRELGDRDAAQALSGWRVFVPRSSFPTPGDDEFYWVDLIGLAVVNREGVALGTVTGLIETGPHCVLRISAAEPGPGPAERLIPFVAAYIDAVSLTDRRITADWDPQD
jgi:16S rRNA processing protein RimM